MEQYAAAGGLATETLGAIRTVTALNAQPDAITRYRTYLRVAMKVGIYIIIHFNLFLHNLQAFS